MNKDDLRILLLQIREDPTIKIQEWKAFASYGGLNPDQIDIHDVFEKPNFGTEILKGYDALFVGGTSEATVLEPNKFKFLPSCYKLFDYCNEQSFPVFASCFGFQMALVAFGGLILHQDTDFEMGTYAMKLTEAAKTDPLFHDTPNGFYGVSVHKEKAVDLPSNCELIAETDDCVHAFRVKEKPFWGFQFHPEIDKDLLVDRLTIYKDRYTDGDGHLQKVIESCKATPEAGKLVEKFVQRILLA